MGDQLTRRKPVRIDQAFADLETLQDGGHPAVTIVTPFYNMAEFIGETAESVLRQTFRDFEWLIVNDGSTDPRALEALEDLSRKDRRVRILHQANTGPGAARNLGFREAEGEHVAQLDADDLLQPTFLEKCLWFLETHPHCGWAHTASIGFGDQNYLWLHEFKREELLRENFLVPMSVVRRSAHFAIGGYDESIRYGHEDWDYWLRMVTHGFISEVIPEYLCRYRRRSNSRISETDGDPSRKSGFTGLMWNRYGQRFKEGLPPTPDPPWPPPYPLVNDHLPFVNRHPSDDRPGVLFVWPWLTMGGADKFNLDVVRGIDRSRFRPFIVTTLQSDNPWQDRFAEMTPEIFHLPNFLPVDDWLRFLVYFIRSRDISVVFISNSEYGYLCAPVLKKVFPSLRLIDFVHMEQMDWKGGGYAYASKTLSPILDRSLVTSQHLRRTYIDEFSRDPGKVHEVYINIDAEVEFNPERFNSGPLRQEARCPSSVPVLLYIARICEQKRPMDLMEITSRLRKRAATPFQVWIVGDGPDLPEVKKAASRLGLEERCVFWGSRRDTGQFYREADIFLLPSQWEGIALTLYEAMAMGLPVIASDVGGQRELVTPETGVLVPRGVPDEIDRFVQALLDLIEHPDLVQKMGRLGRERVRRHFPLCRMVEAITRHLTEVLAEKPGTGGAFPPWPLALDRYSQWVEAQRLEPVAHRIWEQKLHYEKRVKELEEQLGTGSGGGRQAGLTLPKTTSPRARVGSGKVTVLMEVRSLDTGGLEEVVCSLAQSLDRARFRVVIVCVERGGRIARRCRERGIAVEVLGERKQEEYSELLDRYGVDLVCAHYSTFGGPLAAERGIPVISVVHNLYAWLPDGVFSEMKANDRYVSQYVAVSDDVAKYLPGRFNVPSDRVTVIHNGLDVEALAARGREPLVHSRKDFGLDEEDYVFLHVAAITGTKGHNALIRAMKEIAPTHPRVKVLCVGDTLSQVYAEIITSRVSAWGLQEQVRFTGFVERIADLYRLADAFVLPSLIEGWSLAAGEAMFFGLPLILTRVGAAEALIEQDDVGRIIAPSYGHVLDLSPDDIWRYCVEEEPSNVAELVKTMTDFYERRALWKHAGERGRTKILTHHTLQATARRYEELFLDEVLRAKRGRERECVEQLERARSLEEIDRKFAETRAVLETLQGRLDELPAMQAQHLADSAARQQVHLEKIEALYSALADRLSLAGRVKLGIATGMEEVERLIFGAVRRLTGSDGAKSRGKARSIIDRMCAPEPGWFLSWCRRVESRVVMRLPAPVSWRLYSLYRRLFRSLFPRAGSSAGQQPPMGRTTDHESRISFSQGEQGSPEDSDDVGPNTTYDVVCFPITAWGFRFQRTGQLLRKFAGRGHRVFYIDTDVVTPDRRRGGGASAQAAAVSRLERNIYQVRLAASRPLNIYGRAMDEHDLSDLTLAFQALRDRMMISEAVLLVAFPFWEKLADRLREMYGLKVMYDCMDDHRGFGNIAGEVLQREAQLAASADLLVVSSETLQGRFAAQGLPSLLIRNAADFDHFHRLPPNDLLQGIPKPIIGYYGAIAEWFDSDLIEQAALSRPGWSFVLIGRTVGADIGRLRGLPNVHFPGEQPYELLPRLLYHFDVCCIPFRLNDLTRATNPVKFYEYLSSGKPIVSVDLPELTAYKDHVYLARGAGDFLEKLDCAVAERDPDLAARRVALARENSWEERFDSLARAIAPLYRPVSIILVSYNTLDYTRRCVESILHYTEYPNYEIVVIDNGSTDGSAAFLARIAESSRTMRLVVNDTNRGFATATNQGIAAATGAYLVFLNSDTVVTRGWLSGLIRYLQDVRIGLVGPVTNTIGNEARIEVPYGDDLSAMHRFAWAYARDHWGQCFDIPVLAMFCVAMRRETLDKVGLLDENFEIGFFEDDDFALRVRAAGLRVICATDVFVHHVGGASFKLLSEEQYRWIFNRNRAYFEKKWKTPWKPHAYAPGRANRRGESGEKRIGLW